MDPECLAAMRRRVHALIDDLDEVNLVVQYDYLTWLMAHQEEDARLAATAGNGNGTTPPPSDVLELWRRPHSSSDRADQHANDAAIFVDIWRRDAGF